MVWYLSSVFSLQQGLLEQNPALMGEHYFPYGVLKCPFEPGELKMAPAFHISFVVLCSNSPELLNGMKPATREIFNRGTTTTGNFETPLKFQLPTKSLSFAIQKKFVNTFFPHCLQSAALGA